LRVGVLGFAVSKSDAATTKNISSRIDFDKNFDLRHLQQTNRAAEIAKAKRRNFIASVFIEIPTDE
jgi:hypothetical protein